MRNEWRNPLTARRCEGKMHYRTMDFACDMARNASEKTGDLIIAYTCFDCGGNHIGHADLSQQLVRMDKTEKPCKKCGTPIPQWRKDRAIMNGHSVSYCSRECKRAKREVAWPYLG